MHRGGGGPPTSARAIDAVVAGKHARPSLPAMPLPLPCLHALHSALPFAHPSAHRYTHPQVPALHLSIPPRQAWCGASSARNHEEDGEDGDGGEREDKGGKGEGEDGLGGKMGAVEGDEMPVSVLHPAHLHWHLHLRMTHLVYIESAAGDGAGKSPASLRHALGQRCRLYSQRSHRSFRRRQATTAATSPKNGCSYSPFMFLRLMDSTSYSGPNSKSTNL
ncbi:hypothetical protein MSAN_00881900 [Mycena sanguinolenta]|uniref:Uncharacterized protein n=1 Tax=Mycena sanguinolenta TaxID=230812 RepID=A0A8H6YW16_9AGAR|nr:hypothetical protein MSAN_00881900 [Mycena sanguinolenta]